MYQFFIAIFAVLAVLLGFQNCGKGPRSKSHSAVEIKASAEPVFGVAQVDSKTGDAADNGIPSEIPVGQAEDPDIPDITPDINTVTSGNGYETTVNNGGGYENPGNGVGGYEEPVGNEYPEQCQEASAPLNALEAAIKNVAPAADQGTNMYWVRNCAAGLKRFVARAVDANGNTVRTKNFSQGGGAHIGVYCFYKFGGNKAVNLLLEFFNREKLRGPGIAETHICKSGTNPANCKPNSLDFIAGFTYGSQGGRHRISNIAGTADSKTDLPPEEMISRILVPGAIHTDIPACQKIALWSPLVIEKTAGKGIVTLNPMSNATYFDLTGDDRKERISCVQGGAFLTLPDASGKINNINQLFGDNTVGPDGRKASDGFMALGKHDLKSSANGRGSISRRDAVFAKLRLWEDANCNGLAEPAELKSLSSWGIDSIKWINAIQMSQVDPFGNETKLRNVSHSQSGKIRRVFDIWFRGYGNQ